MCQIYGDAIKTEFSPVIFFYFFMLKLSHSYKQVVEKRVLTVAKNAPLT